jgi:hypothetical protein
VAARGPAPPRGTSEGRSNRARLIVAGVAAVLVLAVGGYATFVRTPVTSAGTGLLAVSSTPSGAPLSVDGRAAGTTPATLTLEAGPHTLQVGTGSAARTETVDIRAGGRVERSIDIEPSVTTGALRVDSTPAGASGSVDGSPRGKTPLVLEGLPAGAHSVAVEGPAGAAANREVEIAAGRQTAVSFDVSGPAPSPAPVTGTLRLVSPIDLQVVERGKVIGAGRPRPLVLPAGRHALTLTNVALGFTSAEEVEIPAGGEVTLEPTLPSGRASFNADPWAEVWIGDRRLGETPLGNVVLPIGIYQVSFRHPQLGELQLPLTVAVDGVARLTADMRR